MAQFASSADLALYLGRDVDTPRSDLLLQLASAAIQDECRQTLELVTDDVIQLHPQTDAHQVQLPELPVVDVSSVLVTLSSVIDGMAITGFEVTKWGRVRWGGEFTGMSGVINAPIVEADWPPLVIVTYTHGYDPIPDDIKGVCLSAAARELSNPDGVVSETIGAYSVTLATGTVALTRAEQATVRKYRQTWNQ